MERVTQCECMKCEHVQYVYCAPLFLSLSTLLIKELSDSNPLEKGKNFLDPEIDIAQHIIQFLICKSYNITKKNN